jgi:hypothetical protein
MRKKIITAKGTVNGHLTSFVNYLTTSAFKRSAYFRFAATSIHTYIYLHFASHLATWRLKTPTQRESAPTPTFDPPPTRSSLPAAKTMILKVVLAHFLLALCAGQLTDPASWPGLTNLPTCVQHVFNCPYDAEAFGCMNNYPTIVCVPCGAGCANWDCACSAEYTSAFDFVASIATYSCSNELNFVPSATSIFSAFCAQLTASPTLPPGQTGAASANNGGSSSNGQNAGACAFGANSSNDECNENSVKSDGAVLSVPHILLFGCLAIVSGFVIVGRDACTYGSNADNNSCNDNVVGVPINNGTSNDSSSTARDLGIGLGIGIPSFLVAFIGLVVMIRHYRRKDREHEIAALAAGQGPAMSGYGRGY